MHEGERQPTQPRSCRLAYHRLTGMPVAIKTLKAANFREFGMAFPPREAMLLQKLVPHPCVMRLYETIERPDRIILIQEHLGGGDLFDCTDSWSGCAEVAHRPSCAVLMSKGSALDDAEAKRVFSQVVQGVHWLHLNGVVHRDLRSAARQRRGARASHTPPPSTLSECLFVAFAQRVNEPNWCVQRWRTWCSLPIDALQKSSTWVWGRTMSARKVLHCALSAAPSTVCGGSCFFMLAVTNARINQMPRQRSSCANHTTALRWTCGRWV